MVGKTSELVAIATIHNLGHGIIRVQSLQKIGAMINSNQDSRSAVGPFDGNGMNRALHGNDNRGLSSFDSKGPIISDSQFPAFRHGNADIVDSVGLTNNINAVADHSFNERRVVGELEGNSSCSLDRNNNGRLNSLNSEGPIVSNVQHPAFRYLNTDIISSIGLANLVDTVTNHSLDEGSIVSELEGNSSCSLDRNNNSRLSSLNSEGPIVSNIQHPAIRHFDTDIVSSVGFANNVNRIANHSLSERLIVGKLEGNSSCSLDRNNNGRLRGLNSEGPVICNIQHPALRQSDADIVSSESATDLINALADHSLAESSVVGELESNLGLQRLTLNRNRNRRLRGSNSEREIRVLKLQSC